MNSYLLSTNNRSTGKTLVGNFCVSCEINFKTEKEHKEHYKSEVHRYNLKRKMVNLPPVSEERFLNSIAGKLSRAKKHQDLADEHPEEREVLLQGLHEGVQVKRDIPEPSQVKEAC